MVCLFVGFVLHLGWLLAVLVGLMCLFLAGLLLAPWGDQAVRLQVCPGFPDLQLHYSPWVKPRAFGFEFLTLELQLYSKNSVRVGET